MVQDADLFKPVLDALCADRTTEFGSPGARIETLRTIDGPFSSVQRVRIQTPARTTHAYIKLLKPRGAVGEEAARLNRILLREYRSTQALYDAMQQDDEIGAVRPIALLPELCALATEEVPGRPWGDVLAEAVGITEDLLGTARRVGAWTRIYQGIGPATDSVDLAERRQYLDDRLRLLEGRVLSSSERQAMLARFDKLVVAIGGAAVPAVPIHADLTPMNVIVDAQGRVTVLDFTMAKTGTAYHDSSHVYFHLELMASRHRARRSLFRAVQRAMLSGYDPGLTADDPLFRMMLLQHGVCHVALLAERRVPLIDVAYRWFLRRRWQTCEEMSAHDLPLRTA